MKKKWRTKWRIKERNRRIGKLRRENEENMEGIGEEKIELLNLIEDNPLMKLDRFFEHLYAPLHTKLLWASRKSVIFLKHT